MRQKTLDLRRLGTSVFKTMENIQTEKEDYIDNQPNFDYKDESYNYLINMKVERFLSPDNRIIKILRNKAHTLIICEVLNNESSDDFSAFTKTLEVIVCSNIYKVKTNGIRFNFYKKFRLKITDELRIIDKQSYFQKEPFFEFFLVIDKFLIIDSPIKLIALDYLSCKSATLLMKSSDRFINIIYTFEEFVKSPTEDRIIPRGYLFGVSHDKHFYYFILNDDLLEVNKEERFTPIMKKISIENSETVLDFKVIKFYHQKERSWFYFFCYLREGEFNYYITEYLSLSLEKAIEKVFKLTEVPRSTIIISKNKYVVKKIYIFYNWEGMSAIVLANGDNLILIEFEASYTPAKLKNNLLKGKHIDNENSLSISSKDSILSNRNSILSGTQYSNYFDVNLYNYNIDYNNYTVMYEKHKICFVSQQNLILTSINKGMIFYSYKIKEDDFIDFLKYNGLQHFFVFSRKKLFKFRYVFRFKVFKEICQNLNKIQTKHLQNKNHQFFKNEKEGISNLSMNSMDEETFEKVDCFVQTYQQQYKKNKCFYCMTKGDIICNDCQEFYYCSEHHKDLEWKLFHFFECNILRLFNQINKNGETNCHGMLIENFPKFVGKIFLEIFRFCEDSIDYQEYLIFIQLIIELCEKFDTLWFYSNFFMKILSTTKMESEEKQNFQYIKYKSVEWCFFYLNLKLILVKFSFEAGQTNLSSKNVYNIRDLLTYIKPEMINKKLRDIMNIKIGNNDIAKYLVKNVFNNGLENQNKNGNANSDPTNNFNNKKENDINLYDRLFTYYFFYKATIVKFLSVIGQKKRDNLVQFIDEAILIFESNFSEQNQIMMYLFFYIAFLLVEEDMFNSAIFIFNKALSLIEDKNFDLRTACLYNIGMINYALGNYCEAIHNLEEAYRVNITNNLSIKTLLKIQDTLSLTYIDQKSFRKAYCMIQQAIGIRNLSIDESELLESTKQKFYINFIIDYIEYEFTLIKKHNIWNKIKEDKKFDFEADSEQLIQYVLCNMSDKTNIDLYTEDFLTLSEFIYNLTPKEMKILNDDNSPGKNENKNPREFPDHHSKENFKEINDMLEIKKSFFHELSLNKQEILKTLNMNLFKRSIILRDAKGTIDHFNLNFHPIHSRSLQKIIDNIRSNFFVQEVSKNLTQSNTYMFNHPSVLFALSSFIMKQDLKLAVIKEKFKLDTKLEEKLECKENIKSKSIINNQSNNKKTEYSIFLVTMLEKLNMHDQTDILNDLLYKAYNHLKDEEIQYIMENPKTLLNFIVNDTSVFDNDDVKINKVQERNIIYKLVYDKLYKKKSINTEQENLEFDMTIKSNRRNNLYESKVFIIKDKLACVHKLKKIHFMII